jgi:5-carboxymethyl-2-hydroxymuconate isomerase
MPHLVILYTRQLDAETDMDQLCRTLCDAMLAVKDESGKQVFPTGGTRVLAYPAAHSAVADGQRDYTFLYMNVRMAKGRSAVVHQSVGDTLVAAAKAHLAPLFEQRYIGMTVQIDEGHEVFDAKHSTIHPLFQKS